jgi:hypothetical protein
MMTLVLRRETVTAECRTIAAIQSTRRVYPVKRFLQRAFSCAIEARSLRLALLPAEGLATAKSHHSHAGVCNTTLS